MAAYTVARAVDAEIREILDAQLKAVVDQIVCVVDAEIQAGTAQPISDDLPALIHTLTATTAFTLSGDTAFVVDDTDSDTDAARAIVALEALWLHALWGGGQQRYRHCL